jgi:hypothetical protein
MKHKRKFSRQNEKRNLLPRVERASNPDKVGMLLEPAPWNSLCHGTIPLGRSGL